MMTNDDILGDEIPWDQQESMRQFCYQTLKLVVGVGMLRPVCILDGFWRSHLNPQIYNIFSWAVLIFNHIFSLISFDCYLHHILLQYHFL